MCQLLTATIGDDLPLGRLSDDVLASSGQFTALRRRQFLTGRALLADAMFRQYGQWMLPAVTLSASGKPAFADATLPHFSLSHSAGLVVLALCEKGEIGCDVEVIRPRLSWPALAQALFSTDENQWLGEHPVPQEAFWTLWSLREAWLKQQGRSVWEMASIAISPQQQRYCAAPATPLQLWSARWQGHALALALPENILPPVGVIPQEHWICYRATAPCN